MVYLRVQVPCFRCTNQFEKTEVRQVPSVTKEPRYECFACFKRHQRSPLIVETPQEKVRYFCQRCKYRYDAKIEYCPYCNKNDQVIEGEVTVQDFM